MRRYKVLLHAKGYSFQFEMEVAEGSKKYYEIDNTSMEFQTVNGDIIIVPRLDACVEMRLLVPETTWKEK